MVIKDFLYDHLNTIAGQSKEGRGRHEARNRRTKFFALAEVEVCGSGLSVEMSFALTAPSSLKATDTRNAGSYGDRSH